MQGADDGIADQLVLEGQDGGHLVAEDLAAHAQRGREGHGLQKGADLLGAAHLPDSTARITAARPPELGDQRLGSLRAKAPEALAITRSSFEP